MSMWTYVKGEATIHSLDISESKFKTRMREIFGKSIPRNARLKDWEEYNLTPEEFMPTGSEGSIQMKIRRDKRGENNWHIDFSGHLRDYSSTGQIVAWFKESLPYVYDHDKMDVIRAYIVADNGTEKEKYSFMM